jgi:arginine utilization protein RocB
MNKIRQEIKLVQSYYGNNTEYLCKKKKLLKENKILQYIDSCSYDSKLYSSKSDSITPVPYYTTVRDKSYVNIDSSNDSSKVSKIDKSIRRKSDRRRIYPNR